MGGGGPVSFGCDCSCSYARRVPKFNSKEHELGGVHVHMMFISSWFTGVLVQLPD